MDSDFELLLNKEEIKPLIQPKPELLPDAQSPDLFDADYIPPDTSDVKPDVNTGILNTNVIGHITSQPPYLAKQIKQEIIDMAAQTVMEKHTQDCALNKFIQEWQRDTGLHIEDERTLITADTTSWAIKTEPIESLSLNTEISQRVVTEPTLETQQESNNSEMIKAPEPLHWLSAINTTSEQPLDTTTAKYYEVLTPSEDDTISLCHNNIVANKCSVNLEKLSNDDIEQINATLRNKPEDSSSATYSGEDKPVKKVSLHPHK